MFGRASFPLTPALSLGEKEKSDPANFTVY
jgi:hypothetical protein